MERPKRIQRKRTKGWRMPEGAVYVGRGTMFGNPFIGPLAIEGFRAWLRNPKWDAFKVVYQLAKRDVAVIDVASFDLCYMTAAFLLERAHDLRGKDLACWCPLDKPCHADVLLELANPQRPKQ